MQKLPIYLAAIGAVGAFLGAGPSICSADTITVGNNDESVLVAPGVYKWTFDISTDAATFVEKNDFFEVVGWNAHGVSQVGTYAPTIDTPATWKLTETNTGTVMNPIYTINDTYTGSVNLSGVQPTYTLTLYTGFAGFNPAGGLVWDSQDHSNGGSKHRMTTAGGNLDTPGTTFNGTPVPLPAAATAGLSLFGLLAACGAWKLKFA